MSATKIEWTDYTINPIVGCSHCSPGCEHCYAEHFANRLAKNPSTCARYDGIVTADGRWTGNTSKPDLTVFDRLPKSSRKVFVGSMTDIFHENTPFNRIDDIFLKIAQFPQHTFIFLTKRPQVMADYFPNEECEYWLTWGMTVEDQQHLSWPQKNIWLGVTVCNQEEADVKIPVLLQIPAAKRFVSVEPMLGPISMWRFFPKGSCPMPDKEKAEEMLGLKKYEENPDYQNGIGWVICGAETGPGARHMNLNWARDLRDQCKNAEVPFFFKKASGKEKIPDDLMVRQFPEA